MTNLKRKRRVGLRVKSLCVKIFVLNLFVFAASMTYAQQLTVKGNVTDVKTGEAIPGLTVVVKGSGTGTITDVDGNYSITNVPSDATLVYSFVGMKPQEVLVAGKTTINVEMEIESIGLEEVVAIGYGTAKRKDLTGSVASVTGEKLADNPVPNVITAMQGRLSGVNIVSQDGRPGATMSIKIRGGNSITQSSDPLFVVDGVQVGNINDIPADNIESIDVLKDAASTAIYGARGANGVVLVTTKGAKAGRTTVKYNAYYQVRTVPETLDVLDPYDYVLWNWSYATAYGSSYGEGVEKYFGLGSANGNHLNEYKNMSTHNYVDDVLETAIPFSHDISVSGGNDRTKVYAAVNYLDDEGIRIQSGYKRWNANFKVEHKIGEKLTLKEDIRYWQSTREGAKYDVATSAYRFKPIDNPLGDATHTAGLGQGDINVEESYNPVAIINNYEDIVKSQNVRSNTSLIWDIANGLTARTELSLKRSYSQQKEWDGGLEEGYKKAELTKKDGFAIRSATTLNYEVQGLATDHKLSFLVGNEVLESKTDKTYIQGGGYPSGFSMDDAFGMINMTNIAYDAGIDEYSNTIGTPSHSVSFFGRANYSYLDRYLFTATFRADGSSKFAPNNRWGYFPAAAFAWRIIEEPFMQEVSWLDNLKLRLSYGTSGADNIKSSLWKETWETEQITVDGNTVTTYVPGEMLQNSDLKWETTTSRNAGFDFAFLNSRVYGNLDAYWNTTKDILMKVPVDATAGYEYQFQNVAQTSNKGIELAINVDLIRKRDFNLGVSATYNFNKNNIDELSEDALADTHTGWGSSMRKPYYDYVIREGYPVGMIQGFEADGFYTVDDFNYSNGVYTLKDGVPDIETIVNYASGVMNGFNRPEGQNAFPGMYKFKDVAGDDNIVNEEDVTFIGETMPKHTGGFAVNASYKQLDFSAGLTYQIGGKVYNANAMHSLMGNKDDGLGYNRLDIVKDCYRVYDINSNGDIELITDPDALKALNQDAKYGLNFSEYGITSSQFIEDASYLRLHNLTIGYTLPKSLINKVGIQNLRLYFSGTNLFCLTGYSGIDPDVNTDTDGVDGFPTPYYDYNAYPRARSYTFGLNVTF